MKKPAPLLTTGTDIDALIKQRDSTHGNYSELAPMAQMLKETMSHGRNWPGLTSVQKESLESIAVKLARILTGSPWCADHWEDIAGYAKLVIDFESNAKQEKEGR